jgi:hypothetical protein
LLVNRFQPHRPRSLDHLVLERGLPDRALPPVVLLDPDAVYGRRLGASPTETRVPGGQILVEVFGIRLGRHSVETRRARLARVALGFPQQVFVEQRRQGRAHAIGIAGGLRRKGLKVGGDGW